MNTENSGNAKLENICYSGQLFIDSEQFRGVSYQIIDRHVIVNAGESGRIALAIDRVAGFALELLEVAGVWEGVRT